MTYNVNVPQSGQSLAQTRDPIQKNFSLIQTAISQDHNAISATGQGLHKQVTLYTYGAAPFTVTGNQSYVSSLNASAAGSQLVYQPSVVNFNVPLSPRALARVDYSGGALGNWTLGNGPYGASTNFNAGSVADLGTPPNGFTFNFGSVLPDTNYFVFSASEVVQFDVSVTNKTVNGFQVNTTGLTSARSVILMVY